MGFNSKKSQTQKIQSEKMPAESERAKNTASTASAPKSLFWILPSRPGAPPPHRIGSTSPSTVPRTSRKDLAITIWAPHQTATAIRHGILSTPFFPRVENVEGTITVYTFPAFSRIFTKFRKKNHNNWSVIFSFQCMCVFVDWWIFLEGWVPFLWRFVLEGSIFLFAILLPIVFVGARRPVCDDDEGGGTVGAPVPADTDGLLFLYHFINIYFYLVFLLFFY